MINLSKHTQKLDKIAKISLGSLVFLLPIFFIPVLGLSIASAKYILLTLFVAIATLAYILARLGDKTYILPSKRALLVIAGMPVVFLLSSIATGRFTDSFFGFGFEPTTGLSIILFSLVALLSSVYARDEKNVKFAKKLFLASFGIVFIYQVIRLFVGADTLTLGLFQGPNSNLLGKWNDLAIMAAMVLLGAFIYLKDASRTKVYKIIAVMAVAGALLKVVVFSLIWPILAVLILAIVAIDSKKNNNSTSSKGSKLFRGFGLFIAAGMILYSIAGATAVTLNSSGQIKHPTLYKLVNIIPNYFGGTPNEVRPSFKSTGSVLVNEIKASPVFGSGPNRFSEVWTKFRSSELYQTPYWNTDFAFGVGYFPTLMITTGLLGVIAILGFLVYLMYVTLPLMFRGSDTKLQKTLTYNTILLTILSVWYVPATPLLVIFFMLAGYVFSRTGETKMVLNSKKMRSLAILDAALALAFFVFVAYVLTNAYSSSRNYVKAALAVSQSGNIAAAEVYLQKAISSRDSDVYTRALAELYVIKSNQIVQQNTGDGKELSEEQKQAALDAYATAQNLAERAIVLSPANYINYIFAASIYEGNPGKYESAIDMYNKSLVYSPNNPNAYFGIAKVKALQGDVEGTKEYLAKSLESRAAYTPALLANAQLSAQDKDIEGTLSNLAKAYQSDRSRTDILVSIADIQYTAQNDIKTATQTLELAVFTNQNYAEARLALASLYAKQDKFEDAANLLAAVKSSDKDIQARVDALTAELKAGRDPSTTNVPTEKTDTEEQETSKNDEVSATTTEQ